MIKKIDKNEERLRRHARVRRKISVKGVTLCSASTEQKDVAKAVEKLTKTEAAKAVGKVVAEKALKLGIEGVVFDRGGYLYTGRVQALADGAREAGLKF